ncbi:9701_t:CDS:1 [Scutellospora calospora]|uniref:9701_t:CDS:1 n=1 Tax=Scutellospora calospora TaxID=85575 RepID=A0ACA9K3K8_9GLOM|nr:9701_t:CDS:1 [Scutellospora calospora]
MSNYRVVIRDLSVIIAKSDTMIKNGKRISEVLFDLDKKIQIVDDELNEFRHQSDNFFMTLSNEMKAITEEIEPRLFERFFYKSNRQLPNSSVNFIFKRLEVLDRKIPGILEQVKRILDAIYSVHNGTDNAQGCLIDGEREAEQALKEHWLGNIVDSMVRKRAEDELKRVRIIIKILKSIAPNLINFQTFLKQYRRNIQDVVKEVKGIPKKPTKEDIKYLKKMVENLEEKHAILSSAKNQCIYKSMDAYNEIYLEEELILEEQEKKFSYEVKESGYKPVPTVDTSNKNATFWDIFTLPFSIFLRFCKSQENDRSIWALPCSLLLRFWEFLLYCFNIYIEAIVGTN